MPARVAECVQQEIAVLEEKIHHIIYRIAPVVAVRADFFHDVDRLVYINPDKQFIFIAEVIVEGDGGYATVRSDLSHGDFVDRLCFGKLHERRGDKFLCGLANLHRESIAHFREFLQRILKGMALPALVVWVVWIFFLVRSQKVEYNDYRKRGAFLEDKETANQNKLLMYLSPRTAWALSLGTTIGWGAFVVTGTVYLLHAGPIWSVVGLVVGALVMLVIARNYHYMMNCFPRAGGVYCYAKNLLGYDYGFLSAWFLSLAYVAIFWANATSIPLFARYFLGNIFCVGRLYTIFGYEVYLGEALLSAGAIILTGIMCGKSKRRVSQFVFFLVLLFTVTISFCFFYAMFHHSGTSFVFSPTNVPDTNTFSSICFIAVVSPWAFIGFESISHSVEGFSFLHRKSFRVLTCAVLTATVLYVFVILLSVSAYPPEYDSWISYLKDLGNLQGIKSLPPFYAANYYLGSAGTVMLMLALLALIITSLIGNMVALSRLLYAVAKDDVIPVRYAQLNKAHIPENAVRVVTIISLFIPFVGRAAIGWIVDVTTIGAVIIYGFLSWSVWKFARSEGKKLEMFFGMVGIILMFLFGFFLIAPNPLTKNAISSEAHLLFTVWAILGFVVFHHIIKRDRTGKFGNSVTVWVALITFVLILSLIWMNRSDQKVVAEVTQRIYLFFNGMENSEAYTKGNEEYLRLAMNSIHAANVKNSFIVIALFILSITMLVSSFMIQKKREESHAKELGKAHNMAKTDSMTGVKNKHAFTEYEAHINSRLSSGELDKFAVVVCDVNGLKWVNDNKGHKAGDEYIKAACRMICVLFKHSPVFRIGGDEFVAVLTSGDYDIRESLMAELNRQSESNSNTGGVIVAAGMAEYILGKDLSIATVFERADTRMYVRKKELKGARE